MIIWGKINNPKLKQKQNHIGNTNIYYMQYGGGIYICMYVYMYVFVCMYVFEGTSKSSWKLELKVVRFGTGNLKTILGYFKKFMENCIL